MVTPSNTSFLRGCAANLALCLTLAACGGGGGGGPGPVTGGTPGTGAWSSPVKLSADRDGSTLVETGVAVNGSGVAFGIWHIHVGDEIWASRFDGTVWGTPTLMGTGTLPDVAVSAAGDAAVVWVAPDTGGDVVWARRYTSSGWAVAEKIGNVSNLMVDLHPKVVFADSSTILAVWRQNILGPDPLVHIWTNRFTASNWTGAAQLETGTADAGNPALASAGSGSAVAGWNQGNAYIKRFSAGTWGSSPTQVNVTAGSTSGVSVATNATADLVVTWQQNTLLARVYNAATPAGSSEAILDSNDPVNQINLEVALDGNGNAFALWHRMITTTISNPVAFVSRYSAGSWGAPVMLGTTNTVGHDTPHVRVDGNNNAVAIWSQLATMYSRTYQSGWQSAVPLGSGSGIAFDLAATGQGMAVFNNSVFSGGLYTGATYALRRTP